MFQFEICVPSYKRAAEQLTLEYLRKLQIPRRMIHLFLQTGEDFEDYKTAGWHDYAGRVHLTNATNLPTARNAILDGIEKGRRIVMMDDDIKYLAKAQRGRLRPMMNGGEVLRLFDSGFAAARAAGTVAWGLYPIADVYFMRPKTTLRAILIGTVLGIASTNIRIDPAMTIKEDYDFCCQVLKKYRACVRLDEYCAVAKHKSKGGAMETWKDDAMLQRCTNRTSKSILTCCAGIRAGRMRF